MSDNAGGEARKHHYVPQCYLKGFTHDRRKDSRLYVVDARRRRDFYTTPSNIAAERDFNRIDGDDPNAIEAIYADFESKAGPALVRTEARRAVGSEADLAVLLELVALFAVRSPRQRENLRQFYEQSAGAMMKQMVATKQRWEAQEQRAIAAGRTAPSDISYEAIKALVDAGEYRVDVTTTRHVVTELELLPTVYDLLHRRTWVVLRAAADSGGFVTSDNPATLCWDDEDLAAGFYSPGFASTDTSVVCPLSKNLALRGCFDGRSGIVDLPADLVAAVNTRTIAFADRQLYAEHDQFVFVAPDGSVLKGHELVSLPPAESSAPEPSGDPS
ncbi:DUF4238 domain-containing protein [Burkholderia sp. AU30198]|uniref:DUF4238 domain-containing protein n=1 Tax=Burkholderia sp. AU30198 TaxID=2879627 RepID=UPI001CF32179|nr:DUF4238 domain-containing protein [Burkholderia sp. AU30198]MCA8299070.1 DUF4238 domain-containing protein [Burkholderia sp. AU30198]